MVDDPSTRRAHILLVEDDDDSREVLAEVLEEEGYDVMTAADGNSAVDLALAIAFDVAIIDIGLPRLDGYEVARRIHASPEGCTLRLIALTGHAAASQSNVPGPASFDLFLTKPIDPEQLLRAISALVAAGPRTDRRDCNEEPGTPGPPIR